MDSLERRYTIESIMAAYANGDITVDVTNERLKAIGCTFYIDPDKGKDCNAFMDVGGGNLEPIKIENGKVVGGAHHSYAIYYNGAVYHCDPNDNETIVGLTD